MKRLRGAVFSLMLGAGALALGGLNFARAQVSNSDLTPSSTQCSANPYGYSGGYNPYVSYTVDEDAIKKMIADVDKARAEFPDLYKIETKIESEAKQPYLDWYKKHGEKAAVILQDITYARHIRNHNAVAEVLGKPQIKLGANLSPRPAGTIYNQNFTAISELVSEVNAKSDVESSIATLKALKLPHAFPLDLTKKAPFQEQNLAILQKYPNIFSLKQSMSVKTGRSMECADRLRGAFENADFARDGSVNCEMPENVEPELARFARQMDRALKAVNQETPEAIAAREKAALQIVRNFMAPDAASLLRARPGFRDCGLSDAELLSIYAYTGSLYAQVNHGLRTGQSGDYQSVVDTMNSGLQKLAGYKGKVARGTQNLGNDFEDMKKVGSIKRFKSFTSTSTGSGFGGAIRFGIQSCNGKYIAPLSNSAAEEEVLFIAGTEFRILDAKGSTQMHIELEEICKD